MQSFVDNLAIAYVKNYVSPYFYCTFLLKPADYVAFNVSVCKAIETFT